MRDVDKLRRAVGSSGKATHVRLRLLADVVIPLPIIASKVCVPLPITRTTGVWEPSAGCSVGVRAAENARAVLSSTSSLVTVADAAVRACACRVVPRGRILTRCRTGPVVRLAGLPVRVARVCTVRPPGQAIIFIRNSSSVHRKPASSIETALLYIELPECIAVAASLLIAVVETDPR